MVVENAVPRSVTVQLRPGETGAELSQAVASSITRQLSTSGPHEAG